MPLSWLEIPAKTSNFGEPRIPRALAVGVSNGYNQQLTTENQMRNLMVEIRLSRLYLFASYAVASILLSLSLVAKPKPTLAIHMHCDPSNWQRSSSESAPAIPADYRSGGHEGRVSVFQFLVDLPAPPDSMVPNCNYEISDLTQLEIEFTYEGDSMTWGNIRVGPSANNVLFTGPQGSPFSFVSGTSISFTLRDHLDTPGNDGPLELDLLSDIAFNFPITLRNDNNNFRITAATVTVSGDHYYRVVPEPLTIFGSVTALGFGALFKRELSKKKDSKQDGSNAKK